MRQIPPLDAVWLALESRDTPMHVGALFELTLPDGAPLDHLRREFERMREARAIPPPWNLKLVDGPLLGGRLPLMRETRDVDLDYHIRHSALPHPGGQRELGILVSRLHSHQLDLHRPLWEVHLIEGLEGNRFALYSKMHHSLVDGVSGMRLLMRALSPDPAKRNMPAFWTVGAGERSQRTEQPGTERGNPLSSALGAVRDGAVGLAGLSRAAFDLTRAAIDDRALQAPYRAPDSALGGSLGGQRRFATQQYELEQLKTLARRADCTLNDIVLYLSGTALRRYLIEHARVPDSPLTAGIPVNLRDAEDQSMGTAIGIMVAELGTNVANPRARLDAVRRSTAEAKRHLSALPSEARTSYTLLINGPYIAGLMAGLAGRTPVPFNVAISNVPGPSTPLYLNGARLDALFPLSLLLHGNALNITCVSYAGTLNFGFTGARDSLPHLQRLALYMGEALTEIEQILLGVAKPAPKPAKSRSTNGRSASGRPANTRPAKRKTAKRAPATRAKT